MTRALACLTIIFCSMLTAAVGADEDVDKDLLESSDNITATLQGYEWQLDLVALRALPADSWQQLLAVVRDETKPAFIRERAAASLVAFPNDEVLAFYQQSLVATGPGLHRGRQVESLCMGFAEQRSAAVEQAVLPLLETTEGRLRVPAARCLQAMDLPGSKAALVRYREQVAGTWEASALEHVPRQEH